MKKTAYITPEIQIHTLWSHCMIVIGSDDVKVGPSSGGDEEEDEDPNGSRRSYLGSFDDEEY